MSEKRLYVTTMTTHAVVLAADPVEARALVHKYRADVVKYDGQPGDIGVDEFATMPPGWDGRCYPYGGDGETTIGAILRGEVAK